MKRASRSERVGGAERGRGAPASDAVGGFAGAKPPEFLFRRLRLERYEGPDAVWYAISGHAENGSVTPASGRFLKSSPHPLALWTAPPRRGGRVHQSTVSACSVVRHSCRIRKAAACRRWIGGKQSDDSSLWQRYRRSEGLGDAAGGHVHRRSQSSPLARGVVRRNLRAVRLAREAARQTDRDLRMRIEGEPALARARSAAASMPGIGSATAALALASPAFPSRRRTRSLPVARFMSTRLQQRWGKPPKQKRGGFAPAPPYGVARGAPLPRSAPPTRSLLLARFMTTGSSEAR